MTALDRLLAVLVVAVWVAAVAMAVKSLREVVRGDLITGMLGCCLTGVAIAIATLFTLVALSSMEACA